VSLHYFKILLKIQFRYAPVLSNDPQATQTASDLKKDHPFRSPLWPGSPTGWKRRRRLYELEAIFKDLGEKLPDPHLNKTHNLNRCNLHWTRSFIMSKASDKRLFRNTSGLINTINLFVSTVLTNSLAIDRGVFEKCFKVFLLISENNNEPVEPDHIFP
jgi:hypothetical protein